MRNGRGSGRPGPRPLLFWATIALPFLASTASAEAQTSAPVDAEPLLGTRDWVLVGSLLGADLLLLPLDDDVRDAAADMRGDASDQIADILRPMGRTQELAAVSAATYLVGLAASNRRVADFGLHAFVTLALNNALTGGLKVLGGRARPLTHQPDGSWTRNGSNEWDFFGGWGDGDARQSYPSGHTSNAFAVATVFAEELGGAAGWVAYPLAAGVAWSRVNDEAHWASDVVLGAVVGIVTGRLVVRHGHRRDGWLERTLLIEPSSSLAATDVGVQIPLR